MRSFVRPLLLMSALVAVPIVPFVLFGQQIQEQIDRWSEHRHSAPVAAALIVALLATDVFLPIPSTLVSTLGGWQLGAWGGTLASWIGMNLGAVIGFVVARRWGRPVAVWLASGEALERMEILSERYGVEILVLMRGVPLLAEASVLLVGLHHLSWRRFLPPVLLSNLGLALAYSVFGKVAHEQQWLPLALAISVGLPVLLAAAVRKLIVEAS